MNNTAQPSGAAILAVGTELTSGEIINSNAAFLAAELTELGFKCDRHICVPDDRKAIAESLLGLTKDHQLVVLTGGLGPTTDDFTREVIAEVAGKKLDWNEADWERIVKRLHAVGAPIAESNKQQAYFPESATVYPSDHGTASAFNIDINQCKVFALPGPPREIRGLWQDHVMQAIKTLAPVEKNMVPEVWHCLGQSESKLGEIVEAALQGSGLLTGYRSHVPDIHVKVWVPESKTAEFHAKWKHELESAIAPWLVGRNEFDAAHDLLKASERQPGLILVDHATGGYTANRIFKVQGNKDVITVITTNDAKFVDEHVSRVAILSADQDSGSWSLALRSHSGVKTHAEPSRYKGPVNAERLKAYVAEKAFLKLAEWLRQIATEPTRS